MMSTLELVEGRALLVKGEMEGPGYYYQDAAIFLQEGQNNDRFDTHPSHATMRWYLLTHSTYFYFLDMMASLLLLCLALAERPGNGGTPANDILFLPVPVHGALEILSLSVIACGCGVKLKWQGAKFYFTHKRTLFKIVILVVMYTEAIIVLIRMENHFRVTRALRPLFLIDTHYCYGVRRSLRQILLSLPPILDMLFLLLFVILIFAMLGFYLFSDNDEDEFFSGFLRSFISLFVLLTTANYPDVMMPAYNRSRWSVIYFAVYISVTLYFLMNLLLAVVYDTFTNIEKAKFRKLFLHKRHAVRQAYKLLCCKNPPYRIPLQHFVGLMSFYKPRSTPVEKYLVFKSLNTSHTKHLSLEEFYHVFENSEMKWKRITKDYNQWFHCLKRWKCLYNTVKGIRWIITRKPFEYFIYFVIIANGVSFIVDIIVFSRTPLNERANQREEIKWYHVVFISIYTAEAFLKIVGYGLRKYLLSGWNIFDFLVTLFGFIGAITPTSFSFIVCLRPLRLLLLFKLKERYRDVFETAGVLLPRMLRVALVIILLYYSFGIIGIECFSGLQLHNCCPNTSFGGSYEESGYYYLNNFDDLLHSYVTLFELTVVNNWFIIMLTYHGKCYCSSMKQQRTRKNYSLFQREMGHFRPGFSPQVVGNYVREERYSVVAAIDINGIVATHTVPNAFNTEDFNFALQHFISPSIGRFALGEPCSVVVMDNCRIHDSDETINIVRQKGGIAVFLPPYSPDLNPIEYAFSLAKAILKRNRHVTSSNPKYCMARALDEVTADDAQSFFTECGYI